MHPTRRKHNLDLAQSWIVESLKKADLHNSKPTSEDTKLYNCPPSRLLDLGPSLDLTQSLNSEPKSRMITKLSFVLGIQSRKSQIQPQVALRKPPPPIRLVCPEKDFQFPYVTLSH